MKKGFDVFLGECFSSNFIFGFMSPWHKNIVTQCPYCCLDATYKASNIDNCLLYTVVVNHPVTGTGYPFAYCFTTKHIITPMTDFLTFLKDNKCNNVQKNTIDVSNFELNAISTVFLEAQVQ